MGIFSSLFSGKKQRLAMMAQAQQAQEQIARQEAAYNAQIEAQRQMTQQMVETVKASKAAEPNAVAADQASLEAPGTDANSIALMAKKRGRNALRIDSSVGGAGGGAGLNIAN